MFDLYRAELRRFRNGAAAFAIANLLGLALLQDAFEITSAQRELHILLLFLYTLAGVAFAAFQFGSYRAPSRWIWLLHRPVHRARILAALVLAALTFTVLAVALPQAVVLVTQEHLTARVIDMRHYAGAACLALAALAGWLAGGWIMLHRSRWSFLVLILPIVLCVHHATAGTVIGLWLACNAVLALLLYTAFSPSRILAAGAPATVPGAVVLTACVYVALLWAGTALFLVSQSVPGLRSASVPDGFRDTMRLTVPDRVRAGLPGSVLVPGSAQTVGPGVRAFPVPDMISNFGLPTFIQGENKWTFSADAMLYRGVNLRTGAATGAFGTDGATGRFTAQPAPKRDNRGGSWLVDAHDLYALDDATHKLRKVLHVDAGEWLTGGLAWAGPQRMLLTNRRILLLQPAGPTLAVAHALALPVPLGDVAAVDAARVAGGTVVSVVSGYRHLEGGAPPRQYAWLVTDAGTVQEAPRRDLPHDFPALYEHRAWWLAPVLHAVVALPEVLIDHGVIPDDQARPLAALTQPHPRTAWIAASAAMLLAGAGAAWWTGRTRMAPGARLAWCLACLVLGIPALLALAILTPLTALTARAKSAVVSTNLELQS